MKLRKTSCACTFPWSRRSAVHCIAAWHAWASVQQLVCRQYCSRKLRRLYKAHDFTHGRGKFVSRTLEAAQIAEPGCAPCLRPWLAAKALGQCANPPSLRRGVCRQLMIPLMSAERCWAQAMELKTQQEEQPDARKRLHQVRRLAKVSPQAARPAPPTTTPTPDRCLPPGGALGGRAGAARGRAL